MRLRGEFGTNQVWIDGKELLPAESQKLVNHSPVGFRWGFVGSGLSQLALAILLSRYCKDDALRLYQEFKSEVIADLPQGDFDIELDMERWDALSSEVKPCFIQI